MLLKFVGPLMILTVKDRGARPTNLESWTSLMTGDDYAWLSAVEQAAEIRARLRSRAEMIIARSN